MKFRRFALGVLVTLGAGCQHGASDLPVRPAPTPTVDPPPPPEIRRIPAGFGGPLFQPDRTLSLPAGTRLFLPVMTTWRRTPGVLVGVGTDAPANVLTVSPEVLVNGAGEPGLAELHALAAARGAEPYRIWLEPHPDQVWAEGWDLALDDTPLRVRVVAAHPPSPPCESLELAARIAPEANAGGTRAALTFGSLADDFRQVDVVLRASHPETSLSLLSPYKMPYEALDPESDRARVRYGLYPTTFAFGFGLQDTGGGFEQTLSLGVFDELHLRAEAPGCDPANLRCDAGGRCNAF